MEFLFGNKEYLIDFNNNVVVESSEYPKNGNYQYIFRFPNLLGASVIKHPFSMGYERDLWELGYLKFDNMETDDYDLIECPFDINYDSVEGYLSIGQVKKLLEKIKNYK